MFGIASSTAQESMLEFLLTAQVFPGVSLSQPSSQNVMEYFPIKKVVSTQQVPSSRKRRGNLFQEKLLNFSFRRPQHVLSGRRQKRNLSLAHIGQYFNPGLQKSKQSIHSPGNDNPQWPKASVAGLWLRCWLPISHWSTLRCRVPTCAKWTQWDGDCMEPL